ALGDVLGLAPAGERLLGNDLVEEAGFLSLEYAFGRDEARSHSVDRNAVGPCLAGERAREADDATLARDIGRQAGITDEERGRRDVDDAPVAALAHDRIDGVRAEEDAVEVDCKDVAPFGVRQLLERAVRIDA